MKLKLQARFHTPVLLGGALLSLLAAAGLYSFLAPRPDTLSSDAVPYYALPFGPNAEGQDRPFWPSQLATEGNLLAAADALPAATDCAGCHRQEFMEWAPSLHGIADRDAVYEKTVEANEDLLRHGVEQGRFCEGCHAPNELVSGRVTKLASVAPGPASADGVSCLACHAAVHSDPKAGNGALTLRLAGLGDDPADLALLAAPRDHAARWGSDATRALIGKSELCAACHTEIYDASMSSATSPQDVQSTYAEWQASWYADQGVTCQDCHMAPDPAAQVLALREGRVEKPARYSHAFVGANYLMFETGLGETLTFLRGGTTPGLTMAEADAAIAAQREATHALLRAAAGLELRGVRAEGAGLRLDIAVRNLGAGHNLPTGVSDQKHMWLEVEVQDVAGAVIYRSGQFDDRAGMTDPDAVMWIEKFLDDRGEVIPNHLTFATAEVKWLRRAIPARGEEVVGYDIPLPADARGPFRLRARLWYRVALQDLVYQNLRLETPVPPFALAELDLTLPDEALK
ncbi:multiheme c-type cytochrome [Gemmobacter denitrificans]|uniref:Multiheme c-type cytochrome n=1 Tax=Gemmobacter denitrificans TaxID=3123040 RepID=A0ABU8BVS2_9RHOB